MEYKQENVRTGDYYVSYKRREGEKESFRFSVANVYDEEEEEKRIDLVYTGGSLR